MRAPRPMTMRSPARWTSGSRRTAMSAEGSRASTASSGSPSSAQGGSGAKLAANASGSDANSSGRMLGQARVIDDSLTAMVSSVAKLGPGAPAGGTPASIRHRGWRDRPIRADGAIGRVLSWRAVARPTSARRPAAGPLSPLPLSFYRRPAETVARDLLGRYPVREIEGERLVLRLVAVEAYLGAPDRASHAWGGRRSPRNASLYLPGGHAYVYFIYGMHWCLNAVTGEADVGSAVLLRAGEPE